MKHPVDKNASDFSKVLSIPIVRDLGGGEERKINMLVSPASKYMAFNITINGIQIGNNVPDLNTAIDSYNLL